MRELYLGGARSGKSRLAEQRALAASHGQLIYIATATAEDEEMAARIFHHQQQRDERWQLHEEPYALADALQSLSAPDNCILVDCLTLWLTNWLLRGDESQWYEERDAMLQALAACEASVILVSNEVGQGVVPANALSRHFVDEAGRLHQSLAALCDRVVFVVAGLPQILKGEQ